MEIICDLHTHSIFSDSTYTPTEIIHASVEIGLGAVALCDHNTVDGLGEYLPKVKQAGLAGMECYYSLYDRETTGKSMIMADAFGLKHSGGSDFHGTTKPDIQLGFGKGNLKIPYQCVNDIRP